MARLALALFSLLALYLQEGESISCFICSSDFEPKCADPFNATKHRYLLEDCDRGRSSSPYLRSKAYCRKYKHIDNGESVVVRSCVWTNENDEGPCSPSTLNPRTKLEMCTTCETNECNSASSIIATLVGLPMVLAAYKFL